MALYSIYQDLDPYLSFSAQKKLKIFLSGIKYYIVLSLFDPNSLFGSDL
jgi:hypothetical protein